MMNQVYRHIPTIALASLLGLACSVSTTTCKTCFASSATCESWSGNLQTSREVTARKLCSGKVPAKHQAACAAVLEALDGPREKGGALKTPLSLSGSHFDVRCSESSRVSPLRGCGGFN